MRKSLAIALIGLLSMSAAVLVARQGGAGAPARIPRPTRRGCRWRSGSHTTIRRATDRRRTSMADPDS